MKKRKALKEKENKWKTLKKRFKSTEMRRPNANFERSKTLDERSSSLIRNYMTDEISVSDGSLKDESGSEIEEDRSPPNSGRRTFNVIWLFLIHFDTFWYIYYLWYWFAWLGNWGFCSNARTLTTTKFIYRRVPLSERVVVEAVHWRSTRMVRERGRTGTSI